MHIEKRTFVKIISYASALVLAFGALSLVNYGRAGAYKQTLEYGYLRAIEDLSASVDNIKTTLNKGMYAGSSEMMSELSSKLWSDASAAKISLSQLPVEQLNLEKTNKFLSQVGNYSKSLARRYSAGEQLTEEDVENVETLYSLAESLCNQMWQVESQIQSGHLSFEKAAEIAADTGGGDNEADSGTVTDGFTDVEEGFDGYPTLIYDGPFSDHIMERKPLMLKGAETVTSEAAAERAKTITGAADLTLTGTEDGNMKSFVFSNENNTIAITEQGGFFSYLIKYRAIGDKGISSDDAILAAKRYLAAIGITSVTDTYYEIRSGMCIINFAGTEGGVTLYTDLIKVGVAMDNGEILSYDARGYITNHYARELGEPKLSESEAAALVSKSIEIKRSGLCLIPSDGLNERYCYEFLCNDKNGTQALIYINADTGKEERILLLNISENGILTV